MESNNQNHTTLASRMREVADVVNNEIERQMKFAFVKKTHTYERICLGIEQAAQRGEYECSHYLLWEGTRTMEIIISILESEGFRVSHTISSSDSSDSSGSCIAGIFICWGEDTAI